MEVVFAYAFVTMQGPVEYIPFPTSLFQSMEVIRATDNSPHVAAAVTSYPPTPLDRSGVFLFFVWPRGFSREARGYNQTSVSFYQ